MKHANEYQDVSLTAVENGYKISYYHQEKRPGAGNLDPMMSSRKEEVFKEAEGDKAIKRLQELAGFSTKKEKEVE